MGDVGEGGGEGSGKIAERGVVEVEASEDIGRRKLVFVTKAIGRRGARDLEEERSINRGRRRRRLLSISNIKNFWNVPRLNEKLFTVDPVLPPSLPLEIPPPCLLTSDKSPLALSLHMSMPSTPHRWKILLRLNPALRCPPPLKAIWKRKVSRDLASSKDKGDLVLASGVHFLTCLLELSERVIFTMSYVW